MALASVLALVLVAQGAAAVSAIRALPGPINWIAGGVALLSASVLVVLVVRLGWALRRLRRTPSVSLQIFGALNQRRRWQHLARRRMDEARAVLHVHPQEYDVRFVRRYLADADGARLDEARRRLIRDADDRSSAEWLDHFADRVQAPVDGIAARRVRSYALKVGLGTAASRFSILDQVIVLSACLALLKELLLLYGLRPTAFQTGLLLARSVVTTYLSGVLHDLSDHGVEVAEGLGEGSADDGLIQSLLGKLGQGAGEVAGASVLAPLAGPDRRSRCQRVPCLSPGLGGGPVDSADPEVVARRCFAAWCPGLSWAPDGHRPRSGILGAGKAQILKIRAGAQA